MMIIARRIRAAGWTLAVVLTLAANLMATAALSGQVPEPPAAAPTPAAPAAPAAPAVPAAPTENTPEKPRVLVLPESGAPRPDLTEQAVTLVRKALGNAGYQVVSHEWAQRLDHVQNGAPRKLGESGYASVLATVNVRPDQERRMQGRYRVTLNARIRLVNLEDTTVLLETSETGKGTSFDGYRPAHRQALDELGPAIGKAVVKRLQELEQEEKTRGALFTLGVIADEEESTFPGRLTTQLRTIPGVVPETISLVRSLPGQHYHEFRLRFRGRSHDLVGALFQSLQQMTEQAKAEDRSLTADFTASTRRVLLHLRSRKVESGVTIDQEVERLVNALVDQVATNHKDRLTSLSMAVEPTALPTSQGPQAQLAAFGQALAGMQDTMERKATAAGTGDAGQKALDQGPVQIAGQRFNTLRDARTHLKDLDARFRGSRAGTLAHDIAELVDAALKKAGFKVLPAETDVTTVLDRIKREAALYREEGAVDPGTIAELNTRGAQALVLSWFRPLIENYSLRIAVIDCATGEEIVQLNRFVDAKFQNDLDRVFK